MTCGSQVRSEFCAVGQWRVGDDSSMVELGLLKLSALACGGFVFQFFVG